MNRDDHSPRDGDEFAGRVRDELHRADVARSLIDRLRELMHTDGSGADHRAPTAKPQRHDRATPTDTPTDKPLGVAPRRGGGDAWRPAEPAAVLPAGTLSPGTRPRRQEASPPQPPPPPPTFRDEEGDETELPLEFATGTMGHLLIDQGRPDDARRVFRAVLSQHPDDTEARRGLTRLGETFQPLSSAPAPDAAEPTGMLDRAAPPASYGVSEAKALSVDPVSLVVFWELTEADVAHAGRAAGEGAVRALCVVSLCARPHGVERTERFIDGVPQVGDWFVTGLPPGATHHVAVGLRHGQDFVPIVHAAAVSTPRGRPSAAPARVRATIAMPHPLGMEDQGATWQRPRIVGLSGPREDLADAVTRLAVAPEAVTVTEAVTVHDAVYERTRGEWSAGSLDSSMDATPMGSAPMGSVSMGASTSSR